MSKASGVRIRTLPIADQFKEALRKPEKSGLFVMLHAVTIAISHQCKYFGITQV